MYTCVSNVYVFMCICVYIYIYIYYISCLILSQSGSMYFDGLRVFHGNGN